MGRKTLIALFVFSVAARSERVLCPVTADAWVAMMQWDAPRPFDSEAGQNFGGDSKLVVRGRESFAVLQFDSSALKGMKLRKATLRVWRNPDPVPFHTAGISTISGNGSWDEKGVNFFFARGQDRAWSYAGSELVDVTFGQGGSLYAYSRARDAGGGWWEIDVAPALVTALVTGDQYGLMLCDEKGQTQTRHVFSSREGPHPPELIVEGDRAAGPPPGLIRALEAPAARRPGSVALRFTNAARVELRYSERPVDARNFADATPVPRWMVNPLAPKAAPMATFNSLGKEAAAEVEQLKPGTVYYFAARATNETGEVGAVSPLGRLRAFSRAFPELPAAGPNRSLTVAAQHPVPSRDRQGADVWAVPEMMKINPRTGALLELADFPDPRRRNSVWDGATVRLTGARNEFVAFQLAVESGQAAVSVAKPLFANSRFPKIFAQSGAVRIYREWFVPDEKNNWFPDALVPVGTPFEQAVPGQTVQAYFVDVFIPHDAAPGKHTGSLAVRGAGFDREISIEIEVLPLRLPDKLNFVVDLNCYSGVDSGFRVKRGTPEYREIEHAYHRVAHLNRANLDVLGYSHTGTTVEDHAPPLTGEGAATRVADWSAWDAHFGPIADGSLFADLPRASQPVPAMYLPFFENWPGDLRRHYKFNNYPIAKTEEEYREIVTQHALAAPPVEEAFDQEYQERFSAVAADFARHIRERKWRETDFCVYFNNKYYYKRPAQGGRGVSWWLMDEPNHRDDVLAASFLGHLLKRGLKGFEDVPIFLRTDISRVDWIRDLMAGLIDINCISKRFYEKNHYLRNDPVRFGKRFWNYASTNHPRETNVSMRAWCWRAWLAGADGIVPWNAVRGPDAWNRAEPLTVFYAGSKFNRKEPYESLRLKAYRRGQQDVEYMVLLAAKKGWDREAVSRAVAASLDLSAEDKLKYEDDAGAVQFLKAKDADFEALRLRVARALIGK